MVRDPITLPYASHLLPLYVIRMEKPPKAYCPYTFGLEGQEGSDQALLYHCQGCRDGLTWLRTGYYCTIPNPIVWDACDVGFAHRSLAVGRRNRLHIPSGRRRCVSPWKIDQINNHTPRCMRSIRPDSHVRIGPVSQVWFELISLLPSADNIARWRGLPSYTY